MKKVLKISLTIMCVVIILIIVDIISIYTMNKPIFAKFGNSDGVNKTYYGLLYNTYNCEKYPTPQVKAKWTSFNCEKTIIIGKIIDIKDNYVIIEGLSDNNYLKAKEKAHLSLINNPIIDGANNLIVGQYIKVLPQTIEETYPIKIKTLKISIIHEKDL